MQKIERIFNSAISVKSSVVSVSDLLRTFSFTLLTIIAAQITIPAYPIPFTFQTVAVVLSGAFLGWKKGAISQVLYLGLGMIGLPVFAQIPGDFQGFVRLFGPTGGYLLAFPLGAILTGMIIERFPGKLTTIFAFFAGNAIIILLGAFYLDTFFIHNFSDTLTVGALLFSLWTVIKVAISFSIFRYINNKHK